jgi:hypothetical protein
MLGLWSILVRAHHFASMRLFAASAFFFSICGCSPRVIDALAADETSDAADGGGGAMPIPDARADDAVEAASNLLAHRYSFFNGPAGATRIPDSASPGAENAVIYNAQLTAGFLQLPGGVGGLQPTTNPAYVDLPNFLLSRLDEATIEVWVSWAGNTGEPWQRIFDFGEDFSGADLDASARFADPTDHTRDGRSYLYLTPMDIVPGGSTGVLRAAYLKPENSVPRLSNVTAREIEVSLTTPLPISLHQIVVTVSSSLAMYFDGVSVGTQSLAGGSLADIYDVNCWLGRSQFPADPLFQGNIYEFRIYRAALNAGQVAANFRSGFASPAVP